MEPEPTVFLCPSCKYKLTAGKTSSGLTCPDLLSIILTCHYLSLLVLGLTWLRLSLLVLTYLNRRKNNKCLDLSPLWERGGCGGAQKLCGRNMESSWTNGRAASGATISEKNKTTSTSKWDSLFVTCIVLWPVCEIPIQSWRSAKDLEEQFVSYTAQYAKLLDLVSHPCRLLYKVTNVLQKWKLCSK